jgi:hypothetical protein
MPEVWESADPPPSVAALCERRIRTAVIDRRYRFHQGTFLPRVAA